MAKKASKKVKRIVPQANIIRGNAPSASAVPPSAIGSAISAGGPFDSTINPAAGSMPSTNLINPDLAPAVGASGVPAQVVPVVQPMIAPKAKAKVKKKKKPNLQEMSTAIEAGQGDEYIKKTAKVKKG